MTDRDEDLATILRALRQPVGLPTGHGFDAKPNLSRWTFKEWSDGCACGNTDEHGPHDD